MNTVKITKTAEGRARVTVVSEGERDLSAVEEGAVLLRWLCEAMGYTLTDVDTGEAPAGTTPLEQD